MVELVVILLSVGWASTAAAQDSAPDDERAIVYDPQTKVDFTEDVAVEGELVRPAVNLLRDRVRGQFNPLIVLRKDFGPEMKRSVAEIR